MREEWEGKLRGECSDESKRMRTRGYRSENERNEFQQERRENTAFLEE